MKRSQSELPSHHEHISKVRCQRPSVGRLSLGQENSQTFNTSFSTTKSSVFNDSGYSTSSLTDLSPMKSPINYKKLAINNFSPLNTPKFNGYSSENESPYPKKEEVISKKKIGRNLFPGDDIRINDKENSFFDDRILFKRNGNNHNNISSLTTHANSNNRTPTSRYHNNFLSNDILNNTFEFDRSVLSPDTFLQTFDEEQRILRGLGIITNDSDYAFFNDSKMFPCGDDVFSTVSKNNSEDTDIPSPIKRFIEEEKRVMEKRNKMYKNYLTIEDEAKHLIDISCCKNYHDVKLFQKKAFHLAFRSENPDMTLYNQIKCRKFNILREKDRMRQVVNEKKYHEEKSRDEADKAKEISKEMTSFLQLARSSGKKLFSDSFIKYCFSNTAEKKGTSKKTNQYVATYGNGYNTNNIPYRSFAKQR
uniref:Uncharacterized protein n=1 Tax=Strongyloides papillosus TaxID=174720 RepID=A0A0N5C9E5_STREA